MTLPTVYHQLGEFIARFQHLEDSINNIIILLSGESDENIIKILINEHEYSKRIKSADVLFSYFVKIRNINAEREKKEFHLLAVDLIKIGERRNNLVHSRYNDLIDPAGEEFLLRTNSKLSSKKGEREEIEEELQPEIFSADLEKLIRAANHLDDFRLKIIDWLYPEP